MIDMILEEETMIDTTRGEEMKTGMTLEEETIEAEGIDLRKTQLILGMTGQRANL